jgi:zinc protease
MMFKRKSGSMAGALEAVLGVALLVAVGWGQPRSVGDDPDRKIIMDNGLTVVLDIDDTSPATVIQILIKGGKRAEPAGKRGLSFLTTRLAVEIPDAGKVQELMSLATRFSVTSQGDLSLINIECLSENLEASLKVLAKIILDPLFSGLRIDAIKKHMEHQGQIEEDDSVRFGHLVSLAALFSGTPYEGSIYGDKETLKAIKNRDVSDFYGRYFCGPNMIFSISSDFPAKTLLGMMADYFSKIPKGEPISLEPIAASGPQERSVSIDRETKQTYVSLAYPLPGISPRNFALANLLENLIGKGPGSILWPLRTEKKLAYNVGCRATQMHSGGMLEAYLETDISKRETAKAALHQSLLELYEKGVTEEDLAIAKTAAGADFLRENETKSGKVVTLAYFEAVGLGVSYFEGLAKESEELSLDEFNAYIKRILDPERAVEVVIGAKAGTS